MRFWRQMWFLFGAAGKIAVIVWAAGCLGSSAWAMSFLAFDARSIAMGGTGVVTARSHNASLFNPALLIEPDPRRRSRLNAHTYAGARLVDRDNFVTAARDFKADYQDKSFAQLFEDIDLTSPTYAHGGELRRSTSEVRAVQADINGLSDKPLRASTSYGLAFGYASDGWALGGYQRQFLVLGSTVRISHQDNAAINRLTAMIDRFADVVDAVTELDGGADLTLAEVVERADRLLPSVQALDAYIDFAALQADVELDLVENKTAQDYLREPIPEEFFSTIESRGAEVTEQALSLARSFDGGTGFPGKIHFGVTLKRVDFASISFTQGINQFSLSAYDANENRRGYHERVNLDIGLLHDLPHALQIGLVVRNLIARDLATPAGEPIALRPAARIGLGYIRQQLRLSLDLDLTRNEALGFDPDKQYLGLGAEWFMWRNIALRTGVRTNVVDGEILPSLGLGLGGRHGHLDIALARSLNSDEWGFGLQAGLSF